MANRDLDMWVRLDVYHLRNPKQRKAGLFGRALWVAGLCYAYAQNTDGHIPADVLDLLAAEVQVTQEQAQEAATKLMDVGLWELEPDGWRIHDYETCQETSTERETRRAQERERQRRRRAKQLANMVVDEASTGVTRDTAVSHRGVRGPEPEPEIEEDQDQERCDIDTTNVDTSQSTSFSHSDVDTSQPPSISQAPSGALGRGNDEGFAKFWDTYPKRNGRRVGRAEALTQWQKLRPPDRALALLAVAHYAAERGGPDQLSPEDAQRWLRGQRWTEFAEPLDPQTITTANGHRPSTVDRLADIRARKGTR